MGNLGAREKYGLMLLGVVAVVFVIYFFGIRNLDARYEELVAERTELQAQLDYYEALKAQNDATQAEIEALNTSISEVEETFLPFICAESIEQYVLQTFEDAGCPYLVSATAEDVTAEAVTLPDGSQASDALYIKRITVNYSTTDGFNIPSYNRNTTVVFDGMIDEALLNEYLDQMYWHGAESIEGYDEFLSALATIEQADPDCVKINEIAIKSEGGYILLTAVIDFYSATFNDRVSTPDTSAPYVTWAGSTNINTDGGFIGYPFIVEDPNSDWFMVLMTDEDATAGTRPFAAYYSNAIFTNEVQNRGLAELVLEGVQIDQPTDGEPAEE